MNERFNLDGGYVGKISLNDYDKWNVSDRYSIQTVILMFSL